MIQTQYFDPFAHIPTQQCSSFSAIQRGDVSQKDLEKIINQVNAKVAQLSKVLRVIFPKSQENIDANTSLGTSIVKQEMVMEEDQQALSSSVKKKCIDFFNPYQHLGDNVGDSTAYPAEIREVEFVKEEMELFEELRETFYNLFDKAIEIDAKNHSIETLNILINRNERIESVKNKLSDPSVYVEEEKKRGKIELEEQIARIYIENIVDPKFKTTNRLV